MTHRMKIASLLSLGLVSLPACGSPSSDPFDSNSSSADDDEDKNDSDEKDDDGDKGESGEEPTDDDDSNGDSTTGGETNTTTSPGTTGPDPDTGEEVVDYCDVEVLDIPLEDTGWVGRDCTPYGIQGAWYCYDDGVVETSCVANTPPFKDGAMCLSGSTIEDDTFAAYGAGIGLSLNDSGGTTSVKGPYDATAYGVIGFEIEITGDSGGLPIRVQMSRTATDEQSPYAQLPGAGTYKVMLEDVLVPTWADVGAGDPIDPTTIYDLQIQVVGAEAEASYDICVARVTPITDGSTPVDPTGSDGPLPAYGSEQCNGFATTDVGDYMLQNNIWNESASGTQCVQALYDNNPREAGFIVNTSLASANGSEVASYPSLVYGWHYGDWHGGLTSARQLSTVTSIPSTWTFDKGSAAGINVAYDLWLHAEPNPASPNGGTEVMIWVDYRGPQPIGARPGGNPTFDYKGDSYEVWTGSVTNSDGSWNVISYRRAPGQSTTVDLDLKAFLDHAVTVMNFFPAESNLLSVQAGFEIFNAEGGATATTARYSVSIE